MSLEPLPLLDLPQEIVDQALEYALQRVAEYSTDLDARRGVLNDIVVHLHAVFEASLRDLVDRVLRSSSLLEIEKDPDLADPELVDRVLSNFLLTRREGSPSQGQIAIVLEGRFATVIPRGAVFTAGTARYTSDEAYAARLDSSSILSDTDRLLTPLDNGRYQFVIDVTSEEDGQDFRLKRNARLVPVDPIPRFLDAYAVADFTGGFDAESNSELLTRLRDGIAVQSPSNRLTYEALIRNQEELGQVQAVSIVGHGDAEQVRHHGLFPVQSGGRIDVYVRDGALPQTVPVTILGSYTHTDGDGDVYQVSLTRDKAPGLYEVRHANRSGVTEDLAFEEVGRGYDLTDLDWAPDVTSETEATYTSLQTVVVRIWVPLTASPASQVEFVLDAYAPPGLLELSDFLTGRDVRPPAADVLVKAAVPVFLSVSFAIRRKASSPTIDTTAIKAAVASTVNATGFCETISASQLIAAAQALLETGQALSRVELFGRLRRPDGTVAYLRSFDEIAAPDEPAAMVSPRTVVFYLDPSDVGVEVIVEPEC